MDGKALLQEMVQLEAELGRFEIQFGVKSAEFYRAMTAGELDEFDALDEYRIEFVEWLALYKTWLSLDMKYQQLITRHPVVIHLRTALAINVTQ